MTTTQQAPNRRKLPWPLEFYRSAVGKKWVMALTGVVLIGFVVGHLLGNLKVYFGAEEINAYGEALRDLGGHLVPRTHLLWAIRFLLIGAFALHIHAAYTLTYTNYKARGGRYAVRDYAAASYASRTMRVTGTIVLLYLAFHLADLTWGIEPATSGEFFRGDVYTNLITSLERVPVAALYIVANLALGVHIYHGTWSLFQTVGWSHPRFNQWRRLAAYAVTAFVVVGNLSFPIAVQTGLLEL